MRRRLGELGLTFRVITAPKQRDQRTEVLAVSGQVAVPTMVVGDKVFVDENDILQWLDETYEARTRPEPGDLPAGTAKELEEMANQVSAIMEKVKRVADAAAAAGKADPGNVLITASTNLAEAARWMRGQGDNLP